MPANTKTIIFTVGACKGYPGRGGWAAVLTVDGEQTIVSGADPRTTNNRMEMLAAIKGLEAAPPDQEIILYSDSTYVVNTMTKGWKRNANQDLWAQLDRLVADRKIDWKWVRGHSGTPGNELADSIASKEAGMVDAGNEEGQVMSSPGSDGVPSARTTLTHLDEEGRARMVDVGAKPTTDREAEARGSVSLQPETMRLIREGLMKKGDVLTIAQLAGIMGAKRTSELIPLCHPLPLNKVDVDLELDDAGGRINITAIASTSAKTGVEMEALTAVSVAALTVYDMCKAVDRGMRILDIRLARKRGGQSGDLTLEE